MRSIVASLLISICFASPAIAADVHLGKLSGTGGCGPAMGVPSAESALKVFQKNMPGIVVTNRSVISSTGQHVISIEFPGQQMAWLMEGTRQECDRLLAQVRSKVGANPPSPAGAASQDLPAPSAPDRVVKGWGGDRGWQWTDAKLRKYDKRWRAVNLAAPVDCTPLTLASARMYERGFVGQVAHLEEDGVPMVFMVRDKVQITLMPLDLVSCERKARQIQASQF